MTEQAVDRGAGKHAVIEIPVEWGVRELSVWVGEECYSIILINGIGSYAVYNCYHNRLCANGTFDPYHEFEEGRPISRKVEFESLQAAIIALRRSLTG